MQGLGVVVWLRLTRLYHRLDHHLVQRLRARDLSIAQFDVLAHLSAAEGLTQQELADVLLVTKGNITQMLDRMAERGWLTREADGRANRVYLTSAGRSLIDCILPDQEGAIVDKFACLTPDELHQFSTLLRKVERSLEQPESCDGTC